MSTSRRLVVVCTYNEAENIPLLVERIQALDEPPDVLVVDDDSPDGTWEVVQRLSERYPNVSVLRRTDDRGFAPSSIAGLGRGVELGYDLICQMDADLSHDPSALPDLIAAVEDGADVAVGSRYVEGGEVHVDWGPVRKAISTAGNAYIRAMLGSGVGDSTASFRCYRREILEKGHLETIRSRGYVFLPELLFRLRRAGARITEIPIVYVDRHMGSSKISWPIVFEAFGRVTALGLERLFRPNA